jgi:hypothetical protein
MTNKEYKQLKYPDSTTDEFLDYLKENNKIIFESIYWLVIENCKYYTNENPHYTAFWKDSYTCEFHNFEDLENMIGYLNLQKWYMYINAKKDRSIKRFHIHFRKNK